MRYARPDHPTTPDARLNRLHRAITADDARRCAALLATGIDPNTRYDQSRTPLHLAARSGATNVVRLLLRHADTQAIDVLGNDALMLAAAYGHADTVELLLPHCDPRRTNCVGWSALTYALASGARDCVEHLLPHSDLERLDISGDVPEQVAQDSGYPELCDLVRIERWWRGLSPLRTR